MGLRDLLGLNRADFGKSTDYDYLDTRMLTTYASEITRMPAEQLWAEQPHLRTVIDFIARQVSSVSLHSYIREPDNSRIRDRDSNVALLCRRANRDETMSALIAGAVHDLCIYDEFIFIVHESPDGPPELRRIPPTWVMNYFWDTPWRLKSIWIRDDKHGTPLEVPGERVIRYHGYSPLTTKYGTTPIEALRDILREQLESAAYRAQLWKNGPRLGGVITRPQGAEWDQKARQRFKRSWRAQYAGRGTGAGGVPILEDGMKFEAFHLSAEDEKIVEVSKLSLQTVASIYHIPPTMVGLLDNANYSNVREFRKSLYGEALGPIFKLFEELINEFILPAMATTIGVELEKVYVEFNLDEKLRASFEERASVTATAVGGPFMTVNEARAQQNLPKVEGGDELLRPLNLGTSTGNNNDQDTVADDDPPEEES